MELAPTRLTASEFTKKPKIVCEWCDKAAHPSEAHARRAADRIEARGGHPMDVYLGPECGWWHLTRVRGGGGA